MMKRELIASVVVLAAGMVTAGAIVAVPALAQERTGAANIQFPVAELGNCGSEGECKTYCDDPANREACFAFAESNGLMSQAEAATARKFAKGGFTGPGGCTSKESCESYCDNITNINECIAFAEAQGFLPPEELAEAKQVQSAIARGVTPPACGNKRACDTYCRTPAHMQECIAFGEAAGFIKGQELEDAKKVLTAIKRGVTPPPCGGKEECDVYCAEEANFPQCIAFAEAAGFVSKEEAEMAKKTGGKGPGGCRKDECKTYCDNPANQEACFAFAKEHGLIPKEDLQRMEQGKTQMRQGLSQAPPQVLDCLKSSVGEEMLGKLQAGTGMPSRDLGEKMRACFEKMPRSSGTFGEGGGPQGMPPQGGEGQFQPGPGAMNPGGQTMPPQAGPMGCKTPEECQSYCQANPDACRNFGPGPGARSNYLQPNDGKFMPQGEFGPNMTPPEGFGSEPQYQNQIMPPGGMMPQQPPQEFQSAPPPPPSSLGPQALLGLFLNIFTGR
ncbi:MAG: hypothetical protein Q8P88_00740 [Candidatus Jorgensenbacteria bacterium]|nr:hypothetical protein [Candidatus Jorgensenbacteria bacterium]